MLIANHIQIDRLIRMGDGQIFSKKPRILKEKGLENFYWRMYNPSTGYPPARSAVELEKQAKEIYKRSIPAVEKKFLSQKVISRYLLQELADRDLGNNVWNYGSGQYFKTWTKSKKKVTTPDYQGVFSHDQVQVRIRIPPVFIGGAKQGGILQWPNPDNFDLL